MTKKCMIEIKDEVNVQLKNLDPSTRRKCSDRLKYFLPSAYHTPAFKLGRWDGTVRFCDIAGRTYLNLLDVLVPIITDAGYDIEIEDHRIDYGVMEFDEISEQFWAGKTWPVGHRFEGKPIELRDYQVNVVNMFLKEPQSLQLISMGAGKTIITATLSKIVEKYGRTLVIVPTKDLVIQTAADYQNCGLDYGVYFGDQKDVGKTHTISTWQSLHSLVKQTKEGKADVDMDDFLDGTICVIADEAHGVKGDALKELLTGPLAYIPLRWGFTGTIPPNEWDKAILKLCIGEVAHELHSKELQDAGVLANCHVEIIQTQETASYTSYQSELKFLLEDKKRLDYLAEKLIEISKSGNTLVLVDRIAAGNALLERLPEGTVFVSGDMKSADRKAEYKNINTSDNSITIATFGVASTGISIDRIFNLVMIEPGKSFTRVMQSAGRGFRKAEDKDFVRIWDFSSRCKFSKRHLGERVKYYTTAQYPHTTTKVKY